MAVTIAVACRQFDWVGLRLMFQIQGGRSEARLNTIGRNLQFIGQLANRLAFQKTLINFHGKRMIHDGTMPDYCIAV